MIIHALDRVQKTRVISNIAPWLSRGQFQSLPPGLFLLLEGNSFHGAACGVMCLFTLCTLVYYS